MLRKFHFGIKPQCGFNRAKAYAKQKYCKLELGTWCRQLESIAFYDKGNTTKCEMLVKLEIDQENMKI